MICPHCGQDVSAARKATHVRITEVDDQRRPKGKPRNYKLGRMLYSGSRGNEVQCVNEADGLVHTVCWFDEDKCRHNTLFITGGRRLQFYNWQEEERGR